MITIALSPSRIDLAVGSETFPLWSTQVWIGPDGPESVASAVVTSVGIRARIGRPAAPCQLHIVIGLGDSVTNVLSGTVAPLPGNKVGVAGRGVESSPRTTSRVAPECHGVGVSANAQPPKPVVRRLCRRMPMAWNGPVIQRSMWLRGVALIELLTA